MYAGRFVYTPTNKNYETKEEKEKNNVINIGIDSLGSNSLSSETSFSENFIFELSSEKFSNNIKSKNKYTIKYLEPGSRTIRGGGKAKIFSQERGDMITSKLKLTYGRVMGYERNGYLYTEIINTYEINDKISIFLNPNFSFTGDGTINSILNKIEWQVVPNIKIIPEVNIGLNENQSSYTFLINNKITESLSLDMSITNSIGKYDMAKMLTKSSNDFGLNIKYSF